MGLQVYPLEYGFTAELPKKQQESGAWGRIMGLPIRKLGYNTATVDTPLVRQRSYYR
ncbi:MAG: hypothetical protein WHS44_05410 [Fimbriimonadales bacterium]